MHYSSISKYLTGLVIFIMKYDFQTVWEEFDFFQHFVCVVLSQFKVETTADLAILLNVWLKNNLVTKNNRK